MKSIMDAISHLAYGDDLKKQLDEDQLRDRLKQVKERLEAILTTYRKEVWAV